ncbi:MAG: UDP-N-acetylmuramoyl-tripeptide--D-alanyl-D-alanine ligase [Holosporales bacterium]|jgi:UDP-N-acetylmuramoyl-tripeptide--D-alanyl-D-alanine ligase|nr:UDP-N-acetylmuramoyl-tripeptide--D-alanyl-D-alanine ligase [Holosporales bacterium]
MKNEKDGTILWEAKELKDMFGSFSCDNGSFFGVQSVSIDSRTVGELGLFFAIKGINNDGHDYVDRAFDNGACAAVVSRALHGKSYNTPNVFVVDDTYGALLSLSKAARARFQGKVVEITGSVGKTTIKEMLAYLLGLQSHCHASPKSFNNRYGVPLTLANMSRHDDYAIIEAGMSNFDELKSLTELILPDISFISSICNAHIGNFKSLMDIAKAKSEIFSCFRGKGVSLIPSDSPFFDFLYKAAKSQGIKDVFSFGEANRADAKLIESRMEQNWLSVTGSIFGREVRYRLDTSGEHWISNSLAVLALVHLIGGDMEQAAENFFGFKPIEGRGKRHKIKTKKGIEFLLIDESYNANPESMAAALRNLGKINTGANRRIAIIADMKDLGEQNVKLHLSLLPVIDKYNIDVVFACGDLMLELYKFIPADKQAGWFPSVNRMIAEFSLEDYVKNGDVIMVKGSHGMKGNKIVDELLKLQNDI